MRVHIKVNADNTVIPFDHQAFLTGVIHKWLGWNDEHGKISFYCFSQLEGGKATRNGLQLGYETSFFFSAYNMDLVKKLIAGIQADQRLFSGLVVKEVVLQEDPDFTEREVFFVASPIFIKRKNGEKVDHILYNDLKANDYLKETLLTKMAKAGLMDETLQITFDTGYPKAGTKKISYNGIQNRASWCPVVIRAKPETKLFAWNVGLGNSTGIGFGAIK